MFTVVMTGGIASGKTSASDLFASHGVPILDTDLAARAVVEPGQPALDEIKANFGSDVITASGELNRAALREIIFDHPEKRRELEAILHPKIRAHINQQKDQLDAPYCIIVVPLFLESGRGYETDRLLVIDVPIEVQRERLAQRDGTTPEQIEQILNSQATRDERLSAADDVIDNTVSPDTLAARVAELHQQYLSQAG
jgi:dephospho-CoA kinase